MCEPIPLPQIISFPFFSNRTTGCSGQGSTLEFQSFFPPSLHLLSFFPFPPSPAPYGKLGQLLCKRNSFSSPPPPPLSPPLSFPPPLNPPHCRKNVELTIIAAHLSQLPSFFPPFFEPQRHAHPERLSTIAISSFPPSPSFFFFLSRLFPFLLFSSFLLSRLARRYG